MLSLRHSMSRGTLPPARERSLSSRSQTGGLCTGRRLGWARQGDPAPMEVGPAESWDDRVARVAEVGVALSEPARHLVGVGRALRSPVRPLPAPSTRAGLLLCQPASLGSAPRSSSLPSPPSSPPPPRLCGSHQHPSQETSGWSWSGPFPPLL